MAASRVDQGRGEEAGPVVLKVLGVVLLVWLAFTLLGALFKFLTWALVIGAIVFVGAAAYTAVKGRNRRASGR